MKKGLSTNRSQKNELSRYPQDLNFNPDILVNLFDEEANLIRDIAVLGSANYQKTLFEMTRLTIDDFIKLGYSRADLQRVIPKYKNLTKAEIDKIIKDREEYLTSTEMEGGINLTADNENEYPFIHDHLCITKLDYAFFKAKNTVLSLSRKQGDKITSSSFRIIGDIAISNVSKREKRVYEYQLSYSWVEKLFKAYHLIDFSDYLALSKDTRSDRAGAFKSFYLFIGRMISIAKNELENGRPPLYITTVDDICKIVGVEIKEAYDRKKYVTNFLTDLNERISKAKFEWEYFSPNNKRAKYHIKFNFSEIVLLFFDENKKAVFMKKLIDEALKDYQSNVFKKDISKIGNFDEAEFWQWWVDPDGDKKYKRKLFDNVFNKVYRSISLDDKLQERKKIKRTYISLETITEQARLMEVSIEEVAKKLGYSKDEKGEYYKLQ